MPWNCANGVWSRLGVKPAELPAIAVDREVFPVLLGLLPARPSPEEKRYEMNELPCCYLLV